MGWSSEANFGRACCGQPPGLCFSREFQAGVSNLGLLCSLVGVQACVRVFVARSENNTQTTTVTVTSRSFWTIIKLKLDSVLGAKPPKKCSSWPACPNPYTFSPPPI